MPCNLTWDPTLRIDWSWYGLSCINDNKWTDWKCLSRSRSGFPIHALFSLAVANFRGWREVLVTNGIAGWTLKKMWQQLSICLRNGEKKRAKKKKRMKCIQHADWVFFFQRKICIFKSWSIWDASHYHWKLELLMIFQKFFRVQIAGCLRESGILINPRFPVWIARF